MAYIPGALPSKKCVFSFMIILGIILTVSFILFIRLLEQKDQNLLSTEISDTLPKKKLVVKEKYYHAPSITSLFTAKDTVNFNNPQKEVYNNETESSNSEINTLKMSVEERDKCLKKMDTEEGQILIDETHNLNKEENNEHEKMLIGEVQSLTSDEDDAKNTEIPMNENSGCVNTLPEETELSANKMDISDGNKMYENECINTQIDTGANDTLNDIKLEAIDADNRSNDAVHCKDLPNEHSMQQHPSIYDIKKVMSDKLARISSRLNEIQKEIKNDKETARQIKNEIIKKEKEIDDFLRRLSRTPSRYNDNAGLR